MATPRSELPDGIDRKHIIAAIEDYKAGLGAGYKDSTTYDVLHEQRRYPPKVLAALACRHLSGAVMPPPEFRGGLGTKCFKVLRKAGFEIVLKAPPGWYPDDVDDDRRTEGTSTAVNVNRFERDPEARGACISHYGARCQVCAFDFGKVYGDLGLGFIHVHHIVPLSEIRTRYVVDPIRDLRPVCPNCHAMLHRERPPIEVEVLRERLVKLGVRPRRL